MHDIYSIRPGNVKEGRSDISSLRLSSSASSASLFATLSRPTSTFTSSARTSADHCDDEGVIGDLYTSIQLNAELDEEVGQPSNLKVPFHRNLLSLLLTHLYFALTFSQVSLLHYQRQGLAWMASQENGDRDVKGGVLADAMGLGKTVRLSIHS